MKKLLLSLLLLAGSVSAQTTYPPQSPGGGGSVPDPLTLTGLTLSDGVAATFDPDIVVNGTFTGSATGWTLGGGGGAPDWNYAANAVSHASGGGTAALQPSTPLTITIGVEYVIQFTLSGYTSGTFTVTLGGASPPFTFGTGTVPDAPYQFGVVATTTGNLLFTPTNDFQGTIDTVIVQPVTSISGSGLSLTTNPFGSMTFKHTATTNFCVGSSSTCRYTGAGIGSQSVVFGGGAGRNLFAAQNVLIGNQAGELVGLGVDNVMIGRFAGQNMMSSSRNTILGGNTGPATKVDDSIIIGYGSGVPGNKMTCVGTASCTGGAVNRDSMVALGYAVSPTTSNTAAIGNDSVTEVWLGSSDGAGVANARLHATGVQDSGTVFASLGTPANGRIIYCSDCTIANPCAAAGTGAFAKRLNGVWVCN